MPLAPHRAAPCRTAPRRTGPDRTARAVIRVRVHTAGPPRCDSTAPRPAHPSLPCVPACPAPPQPTCCCGTIPNCCSGKLKCCPCACTTTQCCIIGCEVPFHIYKDGSGNKLGSIERFFPDEGAEALTDQETFKLEMPTSVPHEMTAVFLATTVLINQLYFE